MNEERREVVHGQVEFTMKKERRGEEGESCVSAIVLRLRNIVLCKE